MNHTVKVIIYNSLSLATSCKELTHWKRLWCQEGLRPGGEGDDRGWDGWMASLTRWTWVWVNSGNWWWTGRPGMLRFMGMQRVGHYWAAELNWTLWYGLPYVSLIICKSGLLIFIFAEYIHTMLNKTPLFHQSLGPRVFLFLSLSFSLSQANSLERRSPLSSLSCRGLQDPCERVPCAKVKQCRPCVKGFIGFLLKPRNISLSLSLLHSYRWLWMTRFQSIKGPQQPVTLPIKLTILNFK